MPSLCISRLVYACAQQVESDGSVISLKHPLNATKFSLATLAQRIAELEKVSDDVYGTVGFSEEFQVRAPVYVCVCVCACVPVCVSVCVCASPCLRVRMQPLKPKAMEIVRDGPSASSLRSLLFSESIYLYDLPPIRAQQRH